MKFGCLGCFLLLLILAVVLAGGAVALFFGGAIFDMPPLPRTDHTPSDGYRAQQKLFEIVLRDANRSSLREPVVITQRELNAFLARHLEESEGIPLSPLVVRLSPGTVEVKGKTILRNLFKGFPVYLLPDYLPTSTIDRPVWVTVRGTVEVERPSASSEREYGRLQVTDFSLGGQDLGPWILTLLLGQAERTPLRWPLPVIVETITIEEGRLVITMRR